MSKSQQLLREANALIDRALRLQNRLRLAEAEELLGRAESLTDEAERLEAAGL